MVHAKVEGFGSTLGLLALKMEGLQKKRRSLSGEVLRADPIQERISPISTIQLGRASTQTDVLVLFFRAIVRIVTCVSSGKMPGLADQYLNDSISP